MLERVLLAGAVGASSRTIAADHGTIIARLADLAARRPKDRDVSHSN